MFDNGGITRIKALFDDLDGNEELIGAFKGNAGLVEAWDILDNAGTVLAKNPDALQKIHFLKDRGLTEFQLEAIGSIDDIRAIEIAENIAKRNTPSVSPAVLSELDVIVEFAKEVELKFNDLDVMDDLKNLTFDPNYKNPNDLKDWLKGAKGNDSPTFRLELDEAMFGLSDGETISLGKINQYNNELDVVGESGQWLKECKMINSSNSNKFKDRLKAIGEKFNDNAKLNLGDRDFYRFNGGLKGVLKIDNPSNPVYTETFAQVKARIVNIIDNQDSAPHIIQGLKYTKEITVIAGPNRFHFVNGIHYQ